MAEFGITAAIGRGGLDRLIAVIADQDDARLPDEARACLAVLCTQLDMIKEQILDNDRRILADASKTEAGRRLMKIPGIGPLLASAIVACVPDPATFSSGRGLSAWIGLTPCQNSSGGKEQLGSITKAGTLTCARCSWSAPWRWCGERGRAAPSGNGCRSFRSARSPRLPLLRSQTRTPGSSGRC
jgi:transposase